MKKKIEEGKKECAHCDRMIDFENNLCNICSEYPVCPVCQVRIDPPNEKEEDKHGKIGYTKKTFDKKICDDCLGFEKNIKTKCVSCKKDIDKEKDTYKEIKKRYIQFGNYCRECNAEITKNATTKTISNIFSELLKLNK